MRCVKLTKLLLALVTASGVLRFLKYVKWRHNLLKSFPVPKSSIITGNLKDLIEAGGFNEAFFISLHKKCGPLVGFFLLPNIFNLSATDPDVVKAVLSRATSRPPETHAFLRFLGSDNLMFSTGPKVKELRLKYGKMITSRHQLQKANRISQSDFGSLFIGWSRNGQKLDIFAQLKHINYDIVGKAFFDGAWLQNDAGKELFRTHLYLIQNSSKHIVMPWLMHPFSYFEYIMNIRKMRSLCAALLHDRKKHLKIDPTSFEHDESALTLLASDNYFNEHLAVSTMIGLLNAAFDTTLATLYWLCYNLCRHPEEQEKLRKCIISELDMESEIIEIDDIRNVAYLDAFIKESMRHFSSVPVNQRVNLDEDLVINSSLTIPKGVCVNLPTAVIMKDSKLFGEDVDDFRPSRFLSDSPVAETARILFCQFGGHARMCIGMTFAMVELKAFLVTLLKDYRIEFADQRQNFTETVFEAGVNQPKARLEFSIIKI